MSMPNRRVARLIVAATVLAASAVIAGAEEAKAPHLGTPMTASEIAKWDLTIFPDGRGLPTGHGSAKDGRAIYVQKCASCHGDNGEGATAEELVSGLEPRSGPDASKAIGAYWPYATTIFDYIRRSMPLAAPGTLSADETYALTAYLLAANKIIAPDASLDAKSLAAVKMPNRHGFEWIDVKK